MKQKLVNIIRRFGLLPLAEQAAYLRAVWLARKDNENFLATNKSFAPPPLWLLYESSGHASYRAYDYSGKQIAAVLHGMIRAHAGPGTKTLLEWGCGPARILRQMEMLDQKLTLFGADYNAQSVSWLRQTFPNIHVRQNNLQPPLPFEDGFFDVVYCLSVFTHLSAEMHKVWIDDIERVLKPGGIFIGSFHGEDCIAHLLDHELRRFEEGELVVRANVKEGSRLFCAFHPSPYLKDKLLARFYILQVMPNPTKGMAQTLWVAGKK